MTRTIQTICLVAIYGCLFCGAILLGRLAGMGLQRLFQ